MNQQSQAKIWRRTALGAVAVAWGTFGIIETPPAAADESPVLAQVGVQRRIAPAPTIKSRTRTHIPLPSRDSIQYYDYYGNPIYQTSRRGRRLVRSFRRRGRFGRRRRFGYHGRDRFHHRRRSRFRHRRHRRGRGFRNLIIKKKF